MSDHTQTFGRSRLLPLDALRGLAALIVAVGHAGWLSWTFHGQRSTDFGLCVGFFFVLSGYVLSYAYGEQIGSRRLTLRDFIALRVARLLPLHYLTALLFALWLLKGRAWPQLRPLYLFENLTLTQSLFSGTFTLNDPAWSIGAEFWCGLVIVPLCSRNRIVRVATFLGAIGTMAVVEANYGFLTVFTPRFGIALGCFALGWLVQVLRVPPVPTAGWTLAVLVFGAIMFPPISAANSWLLEAMYLACFAAIIGMLAEAKLWSSLRGAAAFAGNVSFGLYLWHMPLLMLISPTSFPKLLLFVAVLILVATVSYHRFERPMMRRIREAYETGSWSVRRVAT